MKCPKQSVVLLVGISQNAHNMANGKNFCCPAKPFGFQWCGKAVKSHAGNGQVYVRLIFDPESSDSESELPPFQFDNSDVEIIKVENEEKAFLSSYSSPQPCLSGNSLFSHSKSIKLSLSSPANSALLSSQSNTTFGVTNLPSLSTPTGSQVLSPSGSSSSNRFSNSVSSTNPLSTLSRHLTAHSPSQFRHPSWYSSSNETSSYTSQLLSNSRPLPSQVHMFSESPSARLPSCSSRQSPCTPIAVEKSPHLTQTQAWLSTRAAHSLNQLPLSIRQGDTESEAHKSPYLAELLQSNSDPSELRSSSQVKYRPAPDLSSFSHSSALDLNLHKVPLHSLSQGHLGHMQKISCFLGQGHHERTTPLSFLPGQADLCYMLRPSFLPG